MRLRPVAQALLSRLVRKSRLHEPLPLCHVRPAAILSTAPGRRCSANVMTPSEPPQSPRSEGLFWLLAISLTMLGVAPIWVTDILPLVDIAAHLHLMTVMHDIRHSALIQHHYQEVHALVPYLTYYKAVDWLAYLMSVEQANRVVLTLTVAALPWSAYVYLRTVGHSPWLLLGVMPWMLHCDFFMGFFSYMLSIPIFILVLAAHLRWLQAPTRRRGFVLAGLLGLLALTHYLLWAVALLLLPILALAFGSRQNWQRGVWWPVRDSLMLLPSLLLLLPWFLRYFVFAEGVKTSDFAVQHSGEAFRFSNLYVGEHTGPLANLRQIPEAMFDAVYRAAAPMSLHERPGELVTVLWIAALVLWLVGTSRTPRMMAMPATRRTSRVSGSSYSAWVVAILALEYFLMPRNLTRPIALYGVNFRLVEVAMVLLICALPLDPRRPPDSVRLRVWTGGALMYVCALILSLSTAREFIQDRKLLGEIREAYDHIPPDQRVLTLRGSRPSRWHLFNVGEYYAVFRHGYVPYSFADTSSKPVVVDRQMALPAPPIVDLEFFNWKEQGRYYDYLVRFDELGLAHPWEPRMPNLPVVWRGKGWTVWRNPVREAWPPPTDSTYAANAFRVLPEAVRAAMTDDVLELIGLPKACATPSENMLVATSTALPFRWPKPMLPWVEVSSLRPFLGIRARQPLDLRPKR